MEEKSRGGCYGEVLPGIDQMKHGGTFDEG
jgi:hypothetical protein